MSEVQFLAAGAVIFLLGLGVGAGALFWLGTKAVEGLGYRPADLNCTRCHQPCTWFSGRAIGHWSAGGFSFCSEQCVSAYHEENVKRARLMQDLITSAAKARAEVGEPS